jgi:hypothetical protein
VGDAAVLKLVELVCRDLGARDARVEIGGREPEDLRLVWCPMPPNRRLVAVFEAPPDDRDSVYERLRALVESFSDLTASSPDEPSRAGDLRGLASRRLDDELHALTLRTGAVSALVIDDRSPVIWGTSEPRPVAQQDIETALRTASAAMAADAAGIDLEHLIENDSREVLAALTRQGLDRETVAVLHEEVVRLQDAGRRRGVAAWQEHLLTARAIARVRDSTRIRPRTGHLHEIAREERFGYLARSFATIYTLLLVFDGAWSELRAEGAVLQALPAIERLVLDLPPTDPPRGGGKVVRLIR